MFRSGVLCVLALSVVSAFGYDPTRSDNLVVYWGQNSYGAKNPSDTANWQKTISNYCQDTVIDAIPIAFLDVFFDTGNLPDLNLANTCNPTDDAAFPGSVLANCSFLAAGIEACQAAGKIVTLSVGGESGAATFSSDAQGQEFADTIWNLFLGGSSTTRPFGAAVLDGIDLDIEGGGPTGFAAFVTQLRSHMDAADKTYYITAAPQCPYPDAYLGSVINAVGFDALYVQSLSLDASSSANYRFSSVSDYSVSGDWDFAEWDTWAKTVSPNRNVKVFVGAPASSSAGAGYVDAATLGQIASATRASYSSFGGIMLWDASQAYANNRFDQQVKNLIAKGSTTSTTKTTTTTTTSKTSTFPPSKPSSFPPLPTPPPFPTRRPSHPSPPSPPPPSSGGGGPPEPGPALPKGFPALPRGGFSVSEEKPARAPGVASDVPGGASGDWADLGACTSLTAATAKVAAVAATEAALTGLADRDWGGEER
ncbi:Chitinase 1 [Mycena sanguinolenta]|uniref:chitinase n=1 Tax=Mycena sanguinolenta TaxID=230812 RepID=A0A8H6Z9L5_9AGAR|nr:Chitinase 1 [Mycena sanguinolenta]